MRKTLVPLSIAALLTPLFTVPALAEDGGDGVESEVFAQRDIVLEKGIIRPEGVLGFSKYPGNDEIFVQIFAGADWAPIKNLQVGALAVPFTLSPETEYGNPRLYARYRVLDGALQLAPELGFTFNGANILDLGLPVQFTINKAAYLRIAPTLSIDLKAKEDRLSLYVPVSLAISATRNIYVALQTALNIPAFDFDFASIPLGVEVGYSIGKGDAAYADLFLQLEFPSFLTPNGTETLNADAFMVGLGGRFHFGLG